MPFADWMWKWRMSFILSLLFGIFSLGGEEDMRKRERVPREREYYRFACVCVIYLSRFNSKEN